MAGSAGGILRRRLLRDQSIANYGQTVLTAFQEVEDNLAALGMLQQEAQVQSEAVNAAGTFAFSFKQLVTSGRL